MRLFVLLCFFSIAIATSAQQLYFPPSSGTTWEQTDPETLGWCQDNIDSLYSFLEQNNSKSFILLKDGKIVLEQYFNDHGVNTPWYWASAGKGVTAFMVGVAQKEGHLSLSDASSEYLGLGWTSLTAEQEAAITVWHQLTMTSGLDDQTGDPYCTDPACLVYKADAGDRWAYHNGPYTSLDGVIEGATGMTLNAYTTAKLKQATGMTGSFIGVDFNNVFFSTARSMARFGLLMLAEGSWDGGEPLVDMDYFQRMTTPSQELNPSYGYLWWLNGQDQYMLPSIDIQLPGPLFANAPSDAYMALGKNGQFLNVVPSEGLVWLRMGEFPEDSPVPHLLNDDIWKLVKDLQCQPVATHDIDADFKVYPNPVEDLLQIASLENIDKVEVRTLTGSLVARFADMQQSAAINMASLPAAVYVVHITFADGQTAVQKVVKH